MLVGAVRGTDGFGMFAVDSHKNDIRAAKVAGVPQNLFGTLPFKEFTTFMDKKATIAVGHHRSATKGTVNDQNAHPFHFGHITMVHNGTLTSGVDLKKFSVDSEGICAAIAEHGVEAFSKLHGAYACVWWDSEKKQLHFFKNDERPLTIIKHRNSIIFASEWGMLDWLLRRTQVGFTDKDVTLYKIHKDREYWIPADGLLKEGKEPIKKHYTTTTYYPPYSQRSYHGSSGTSTGVLTKAEKKEQRRLRRQRAKASDKSVIFWLYQEMEIRREVAGASTIVCYRYLGFSDRQEPMFVDCPTKLDFDWNHWQWEGIIKGGPIWNMPEVSGLQQVCYEIDYDSIVTEDDFIDSADVSGNITVYPLKAQNQGGSDYVYTLNNKMVSKYNINHVLAKGCAVCSCSLLEKDVKDSLGLTYTASSAVNQLICPVCTNEEIKA